MSKMSIYSVSSQRSIRSSVPSYSSQHQPRSKKAGGGRPPMDIDLSRAPRRAPNILKKTLNEFFCERVEERVITDKKLVAPTYSPAAEVINMNNNMACLDKKVMAARNQWAEEKRKLDERWASTKKNHEDLLGKICSFNNHYKDTFQRRIRAQAELKLKEDDLDNVDKELHRRKKVAQRLRQIKDASSARLDTYSVFGTFFEKAIKEHISQEDQEHPDSFVFKTPSDAVERHNALSISRDKLVKSMDEIKTTISRRQRALEKNKLLKTNEIMAYRNYLTEMLELDSNVREEVYWLESGLFRIKLTAAQRTLIIGEIRMAILNLYRQICKTLDRHTKINYEDTLGQLVDIRLSVKELSHLCQDVKRMMKVATLKAKAEADIEKAKNRRIEEERLRNRRMTMNKKEDEKKEVLRAFAFLNEEGEIEDEEEEEQGVPHQGHKKKGGSSSKDKKKLHTDLSKWFYPPLKIL